MLNVLVTTAFANLAKVPWGSVQTGKNVKHPAMVCSEVDTQEKHE